MQVDVDKILRNLGVLGSLKQNDKLLTEGEFFAIYVPTAWRSLYRTFYRESREQNMKKVDECIRSAKAFVTTTISEHGTEHDIRTLDTESVPMRMHRHEQVQVCSRVLACLTDAVDGLDNLTQTYVDDAALIVKIKQLKSDVIDFIETTQTVAQRSPVIVRLS